MALSDTSTATKAAASALWAWATMLTGNQSGTNGPEGARPSSVYWTLVGSSNSSTAGIDATDRLHLTGSFTIGDWVSVAAGGTPHTWFVLQSPSGLLDGPWYMCIDYIGSDVEHLTIVVNNAVFSGGSTSARPTSTGESAATGQSFISTTAGASKAHLSTDANGGFRLALSRNGTGFFSTAFGIEPMVEYHSGDAARTVLWWSFLDSGSGAMTTNNNWIMRGKLQDNSASSTTLGIADLVFRPSGSDINTLTTTNSIDSTVDALPVAYIMDTNASHHGIRGRLPDMWMVGAQIVPGSTVPGSGSPERMMVGQWLIASSVAPSL